MFFLFERVLIEFPQFLFYIKNENLLLKAEYKSRVIIIADRRHTQGPPLGTESTSMRRRLFAGMKSLTGFGSRSRHGSPGHRSISLPESTQRCCCFSFYTSSFLFIFAIIFPSLIRHICVFSFLNIFIYVSVNVYVGSRFIISIIPIQK